MIPKPCLACGKPTKASRCDTCKPANIPNVARSPKRKGLYDYAHRKASRLLRATATACHWCGEGFTADDPCQADHLTGEPGSPLVAAHRSCNIARANRAR